MSDDEKKETFREAKILEVLNHPNIIRFKEVYKTKKGQLCIVMDYADGKYNEFHSDRWWFIIVYQKLERQGFSLWRLNFELVHLDLFIYKAYPW